MNLTLTVKMHGLMGFSTHSIQMRLRGQLVIHYSANDMCTAVVVVVVLVVSTYMSTGFFTTADICS